MPRVSIGLPVYNGENFVREALESILAQTYSDFELIISDNASTDRTAEICLAYAAADPRIRYSRNPENVGPSKNYNRAFELSCGEYFKWAAHDDIVASKFLEKCVPVLDCDPTIVVVYPITEVIDERGEVTGTYNPDTRGFDSHRVYERFGARTSRIRPPLPMVGRRLEDADPIFGLIRSSALRATPLLGTYLATDHVLLARLALLGRFVKIPEGLFFNRDHANRSVRAYRGRHLHAAWLDPGTRGRIEFPDWMLFGEFLACIKEAPLTPYERARCYGKMCFYLLWNWPRMLRDVFIACSKLLACQHEQSHSSTATADTAQ